MPWRVELFQITVTEKTVASECSALELFTAVVKLELYVRIIAKTT